MSYTIQIIDTVDNTHVTIEERAGQSSVVLKWNGADTKDGLGVVGSSLSFNLYDTTNTDGFFSHLFTGNETRYRVFMFHTETGTPVWNGFILPDRYGEPWTNGNTFVSIMAADGLGRLKGKYLSEGYYSGEKTPIDVICECLSLTGLSMDLFFAPAIENSVQKNYHQIYIPMAPFMDNGKKNDAYTILGQLANDMVCCVYQANDRWHFEGLNRRHFREITYSRYLTDGTYVSDVEVVRNLKTAIAKATPFVTLEPAYGEIFINNERAGIGFPDDVVEQKNTGWAITTGVDGFIKAKHWFPTSGILPLCKDSEYYVLLPTGASEADMSNYVELIDKPYVYAGQKLNFSAKFRIIFYNTETQEENTDFDANWDWAEIMRFDVRIGQNVVSANLLSFDSSGACELDFDIMPETSGLLDVWAYQPYIAGFITGANARGVQITELYLSEIAFEESSRVNKSINDDFTVVKEYDLLFADGFNSNENAFRLQPLESKTQEFVPVVVPVLYGFAQNGKNYAVVQLDGANLIDNNLESVRYNGELLSPLEVVYNYATGEQMAVVTPDMITSGNFTVEVYKNDVVISDRAYWKQWTDAVYKIEKKGYAETVAGVFQRMFALAHHKIEMTVKQSVKFNDFISFDYKGRSDYPVLNCSWDVSNNESTVTIVKAFYRDNDLVDPGSENNILPIVDAGADIAMAGGQRDVSLGATAYDPDGYIVSFLWEIVSGGGGLISNPTSAVTNVTGLTGDDYVIRVTVTDNDGGVAFDEITLSRVLSYTVTLPLVNDQGNGANSIEVKEYRLFLDPALAANGIVKFSGTYSLRTNKKSNYNSAYAKFYIVKNGTRIFEKMVIDLGTENGSFEFNFIASDTIDIGLEGTARIDDPGYTSLKPETWASFVLANYEFVGGGGVVIGLPLEDQSMYIEGY